MAMRATRRTSRARWKPQSARAATSDGEQEADDDPAQAVEGEQAADLATQGGDPGFEGVTGHLVLPPAWRCQAFGTSCRRVY